VLRGVFTGVNVPRIGLMGDRQYGSVLLLDSGDEPWPRERSEVPLR
jgi:hypothetical protein